MRDERIEKLANLLVHYSVAIRPGDRVAIRGSSAGAPLLREIYKQVLLAGGHPLMQISLPGLDEVFYQYASDAQLEYIHEPVKHVFEHYDATISVMASENTRSLTQIDPSRMVIADRASEPIFRTFMERAARDEVRWTLTLFPTQAHAQDAEMSLEAYEDFVYNACMPDLNDPIGYWKRVSAEQERVVEWLKGKQQVRVTAPGTDLTLRIAGRKFINCDCTANVPDGEVFTGPVEDSVNGHVHFTYPTIFGGREVRDVRLWFENGKVVKATAGKNEDFLLKTLDTDEGARYVGEFAIGTNKGIQQFTGEILFDEKIGGSFHMALGASYPETGGVNQSAIHWDMICDLRSGGEIWVDGELMYQNGKFVI
jgi:aminopeptidase